MTRVAAALVLLALLGVAGCGDDKPAPSVAEVPEWAKVAPEQIAEAKKHGVPVAFENDLGMRFVLIPAGTFLMGSPEDEEGHGDDETQHEVTISRPFYMQITEVTNEQYRNHRPGHTSWKDNSDNFDGFRQPAASLSWEDARAYAAWLAREGRQYRLPAEAEWEYACRAGTLTPFSFGASISATQAAFDGSTGYGRRRATAAWQATADVGSFSANSWGLYDMHGNIQEWCEDRYAPYAGLSGTASRGPADRDLRVLRGGSWLSEPASVRSAQRWADGEDCWGFCIGIRLVSPLPERGE